MARMRSSRDVGWKGERLLVTGFSIDRDALKSALPLVEGVEVDISFMRVERRGVAEDIMRQSLYHHYRANRAKRYSRSVEDDGIREIVGA